MEEELFVDGRLLHKGVLYNYINFKKHLFETADFSDALIRSVGKVVSSEIYRSIIRGDDKILINIRDDVEKS